MKKIVASHAISGEDAHLTRLRMPSAPIFRAACVGFAYYLVAVPGDALALPLPPVRMFWASNAILLAALIFAQRKDWWLYVGLVLPAHLLVQLNAAPLVIVAIQYAVNCSTALIGAFALSALAPDTRRFDRLKPILVLIAFGAVLAPIATSVLLAAALVALGVVDEFWITAMARSLTNAFAILTLVPLMVHAAVWIRKGSRPVPALRAGETCLLAVTLATLGIMVFAAPIVDTAQSTALLYAPLPILLWAAMRYGVVGVCASMLLLGTLGLWGLFNESGPFISQSPVLDALSVILYLVVLSIPLLLLAAALAERNTLQAAQGRSEARFDALFSRNIVATTIWQAGGKITDANDAFFRMTGFDRGDIEGDRLRGLGMTQPLTGTTGPVSRRAPEIATQEHELVLRDGRRIPVLVESFALPGRANEGVSFALDLSSVRLAEEARRQTDLLHAAILASVRDQIVVLDAAGVIIEVNDSWRRFVEIAAIRPFESAQIGSHYLEACSAAAMSGDAMAADLLAGVHSVLDGLSARRRLEFGIDTADGVLWFEICIEPLRRLEGGAVIIRTDITERKRATLQAGEQRQQLALLGRAAVLGELSGALAHELNQPLTSILGNAEAALQMLMRDPADIPEIRNILRDIIQDDVRAAEVIQRLRSMLARGEIQRQPVDMNQVVREVLDLTRSDLITRGVSVGMQLDANLTAVLADRVQMQQVVLNLIVNACEAMTDVPHGERRLTIATRVADDRSFIECSVSDRGSGVAEGEEERIFQPFVTTKKHGLGLGLAICRSIVEAHGGRLWAESSAEGAMFRFTARIDA
jgi:PAS domain S-box-containing protein